MPGTAVTVTLDGKRPMIGEVQALVGAAEVPSPRRAVSGIDQSRAAMITAVLQAHSGLDLARHDVYLSTVGGMRLTDPSSDLAIALAVTTSYAGLCLPTSTIAIGEVGLAGDLRRVTGMDRRLAEAARLGFRTALVPAGTGKAPRGLRLLQSATLAEAIRQMLDIAAAPSEPVPQISPPPRPNLRVVDPRGAAE